jgi:hypothetical protein
MIQQISVFAENQPGKLEKVTRILSRVNVNIRAVTISDLGEYGVVKLLVDQPQKGYDELKAVGVAAKLVDVVAVSIDDRVGDLAKPAHVLADNCVNIKHAYGFVVEKGKQAVFIFEVDNAKLVARMLTEAGHRLLTAEDLAGL